MTVGIWSHAVQYMKFHRFPGMPARTEIRNGYICSTGKSICKKNAYGILVHRTGAVCGRDEAVYSALGKAKHEGNIRLSDDKDDRHRNPVRILDTICFCIFLAMERIKEVGAV